MRSIATTASLALLALPLIATAPPARAADNDLMGQAQRLFNNGNDRDRDRDAYARGREDEMRRQQADRDSRRWHRDHDGDWSNRDDRGRNPSYGSNYR